MTKPDASLSLAGIGLHLIENDQSAQQRFGVQTRLDGEFSRWGEPASDSP